MRNQMLMAAAAAISLGGGLSQSGYRYSGGGQTLGQFQLRKSSILSFDGNPTCHTGGTVKYRQPKPPRAKFTREQRISAAKAFVNFKRMHVREINKRTARL
jgi:hypothetical protein